MRVDTVDYRSLAGGGQEQKNVQVIHQPNSSGNSTTSGGVLADAAAALETTLQSAKDAISRVMIRTYSCEIDQCVFVL